MMLQHSDRSPPKKMFGGLTRQVGCGLTLVLISWSVSSATAQETNPETAAPVIGAPEPHRTESSSDSQPPTVVLEAYDGSTGVGFLMEYRQPLGGDYRHVTSGALYLEQDFGRYHGLSVSAGAGVFELQPFSPADLIAHQPYYGSLGLGLFQYFTPPHTFLRPYATLRGNWMFFAWEYRSSAGPPGVDADWLHAFDGFVGMGVSVGMRKHWRVFGEVGAGVFLFEGVTDAGFRNTMFDNFGYLSVKAGISIRF